MLRVPKQSRAFRRSRSALTAGDILSADHVFRARTPAFCAGPFFSFGGSSGEISRRALLPGSHCIDSSNLSRNLWLAGVSALAHFFSERKNWRHRRQLVPAGQFSGTRFQETSCGRYSSNEGYHSNRSENICGQGGVETLSWSVAMQMSEGNRSSAFDLVGFLKFQLASTWIPRNPANFQTTRRHEN